MNLFLWNPDRSSKYTRIVDAPTDQEGNLISLWASAALSEAKTIYLRKQDTKLVPDFLYDIGLQIFVSEAAKKIISLYVVPHVSFFPVHLINDNKNVVANLYWLNIMIRAAILDRLRSRYTTMGESIWTVDEFVLDEDAVPEDDVFLCEELGAPIFSERLVAHIRSQGLTGTNFLPLSDLKWP